MLFSSLTVLQYMFAIKKEIRFVLLNLLNFNLWYNKYKLIVKEVDNMKIIKKDGRLQDYDEKKIGTSIENASTDVLGISLNESDIRIVVKDVSNKLRRIREGDSLSSTYEIVGVLIEVLIESGFKAIVKPFIEH